MDYYIVVFIYMKKRYYLIWISDEKNEFFNKKGEILFWKNLKDINEFAIFNNITFSQNEAIMYDIDNCLKWCLSDSRDINCNDILNIWNITSDIYYSIKKEFIGDFDKYNMVYDKLFYGNNLPIINTSKEKYIPTFSENEIKTIKKILKTGLMEFRAIFITDTVM